MTRTSTHISKREQIASDNFHFDRAIKAARRRDEEQMYYHLGQILFDRISPRRILNHPALHRYKKDLEKVYLINVRP